MRPFSFVRIVTPAAETDIGKEDSAAVKIGPDSALLDPTPREKSEPKPAAVVATFVEFGTVHHAPNAFMTRAFESAKEAAEAAVVEKLKEIVK